MPHRVLLSSLILLLSQVPDAIAQPDTTTTVLSHQNWLAQAAPRPTANANGDYAQRTSHRRWLVVDPDPRGLNCRWSRSMPLDWYAPHAQLPQMNVLQWQIVRRFPSNTVLTANTTPAGFATISDDRGFPWLKVSIGPEEQICLVRANRRYIRPIE